VRTASSVEQLVARLRAAQARTLAAADAERRRIERDLHDGAQQQIVAVRAMLSLAGSSLGSTDPAQVARTRALLVDAGRELEGALDDLRRLAHGLFPRLLSDEGLASALRAAARQCALATTVDAQLAGRLPPAIEHAAYFCCHEALQNAAKHAGRQASVAVRLSIDGSGALVLEIRDDGSGFDVAGCAAGSGLANMRDRVEACGGTLAVESCPAAGTRIAARIPEVVPVMDPPTCAHTRRSTWPQAVADRARSLA
jgi:signal transduction histidine kinase